MALDHIRINFETGEGTLRRVLGLVEARGFAIRSLQMSGDDQYSVLNLGLLPHDATRRVSTLLRQIYRLEAVISPDQMPDQFNGEPVVREMRHAAS